MSPIGIPWALKSVFQVFICCLIQEDKIVVVPTQCKKKGTKLKFYEKVIYSKRVDYVDHTVW